MSTLERTLPATTVGRYLVEPTSGEAAGLLIGFHGYGQNAELQMADLRAIPGGERWHKVSVLGLHRFYNTKTGAVVASWMTSLDREQAMADNVAYVRAVVEAARAEHPAPRLVFAGFSQGASMAWRAAARSARADGVVVLGGDVPPDVKPEEGGLPPSLVGRGAKDEWYSDEKLQADLTRLRRGPSPVEPCVFEGGHEWTAAFAEAAGRFLGRL